MRLIDANELIATIEKNKGQFPTEGNEPFMAWEVIDYINDCETINPEDFRPQGEWTNRYRTSDGFYMYKCSNCGTTEPHGAGNYCRFCGAKMNEMENDI